MISPSEKLARQIARLEKRVAAAENAERTATKQNKPFFAERARQLKDKIKSLTSS